MADYKSKNIKEKDFEIKEPKILDERFKNKNIVGLFCLFGEEEYMVDFYSDKFKIYAEKNNMNNCVIFDPDNFDFDLFCESALEYSLDGEPKIIILKNCDNIKTGDIAGFLSENNVGEFACIVFKFKKFEDNSSNEKKDEKKEVKETKSKGKVKKSINLIKYLKENAELYEFKINSIAKLIKWQKNICSSENIILSEEIANYILNFGELKMYALKNELDKLIRFVKSSGRNEILKQDVDLLLNKKLEMQAFEMSNAMVAKDYKKALEILEKLRHFKEEPVIILSQISGFFCDLLPVFIAKNSGLASSNDNFAIAKKTGLNEIRVKIFLNALRNFKEPENYIKSALNLCRDCDVKLKSVNINGYVLLENLIYNLAVLK